MSLCAAVNRLLAAEAQALGALKELLVREHAALQARDGGESSTVAAAKREVLQQLEELGRERGRLLTRHGLANDGAGFDALLLSLEPAERETAESRWASVREELRRCHGQNRINGLLLDASLRATHEALAILLGHHPGEAPTYTSQGALDGGLGTRACAKA